MGHFPQKLEDLDGTITTSNLGFKPMVKCLRKGLLASFLVWLLLVSAVAEFRPSTIDLLITPYTHSVVGWELSHFPDKWLRKVGGLLAIGSSPDREEKLARVQEFFALGQDLADQQNRLIVLDSGVGDSFVTAQEAATESEDVRLDIDAIRLRLQALQPGVEGTMEDAFSAVVTQQGLSSMVGVFPPVDAVFSSSPNVLILSPRDRILRQQDFLLQPSLADDVKDDIETRILRDENMSALVASTGGVALYPSVVSHTLGLRHAAEVTAHEWLHQWFLFRPLGRVFWSGQDMAILNETAATIAGEELGDLLLEAITGDPVDSSASSGSSALNLSVGGEFDFRTEMQETRLQAEELLSQGKIEEAEAYMEARRRVFLDNGYLIRKINQAYFAFHGTYATTGASTSPIGDQLRELRRYSDSVGAFVRTVAEFGTYREFIDYLEEQRSEVSSDGAGS